MADESLIKYNKIAKTFETDSETVLQEIDNSIDMAIEDARNNYTGIQGGHKIEYMKLANEGMKGNKGSIESVIENFKVSKSDAKNLFEVLKQQTTNTFDQTIAKFVMKSEESVKKFPVLTPGTYQDVLKYLKDRFAKTMTDAEKQHEENVRRIDVEFPKLLQETTFPEMKPPNIITLPPIINGEFATTTSNAGPSRPS